MLLTNHHFSSAFVDPLCPMNLPDTEEKKRDEEITREIQEALTTTMQYSTSSEQEKKVIVHRIKKGDTFAGISLLYNVPIEQIKKLNRLWSTDSIHFRKFLYIPLELVHYQQVYCKLKVNSRDHSPELCDDTSSISTDSTWEHSLPPKLPLVSITIVSPNELRFFTNSSLNTDSLVTREDPCEEIPSFKDVFGITLLGNLAYSLGQAYQNRKIHATPREDENYEL
ncbi:hypothetical protein K7432_005860 [Basidiobolus ranarum]|uniref:LysM domain-containing protein n=1 Tax=Basidiobolus ranarum TaxID=34480 RepID=A0ABR2WVY3_9FUNG